jgi:hypothetical protein
VIVPGRTHAQWLPSAAAEINLKAACQPDVIARAKTVCKIKINTDIRRLKTGAATSLPQCALKPKQELRPGDQWLLAAAWILVTDR